MTFTGVASVNPGLLKIIERHTAGLQDSVDGSDLYALIAQGVRRFARRGPIGAECFAYLHAQLDTYARDPITLPAMRIKARLLQQHLASYLPENETTVPLEPSVSANAEAPALAVVEVLHNLETGMSGGAEMKRNSATLRDQTVTADLSRESAVAGVLEQSEINESDSASAKGKTQQQRYQALLRSEQDAWRTIYGTVKDFEQLKRLWMGSLDDLAQERDTLQTKLGETTDRLATLNAEMDQLRSELDKVRKGSSEAGSRNSKHAEKQSREKTAAVVVVSSRDVFDHQLRVEIERVKRTGGALTLALIGVEDLGEVAKQHGYDASEAVMGCYGDQMLASFRVYDRVARYDQDRFVVLLPDTQKDGAVRAIEKVHKRARATHVNYGDKSLPLPGFSGVLTQYCFGEAPLAVLKRIDRALDNARQNNRNHIVFVS